jgi:acetyl esterase/lipase
MDRRLLCLIFFFMVSILPAFPQTLIPLYPAGKIPNSKRSSEVVEKSEIRKDGLLIVNGVTEPDMAVYLPEKGKANGTAVIIYPGGGYWVLASGHEGIDVAKAFNLLGITAFVLKYRLPDARIMITPEIGPLQDAQRAIQIVRQCAAEWNIQPSKIGIIGFSAGGHLASTAGTKFMTEVIANPEHISLRPDFMILLYPVISSDTSIAHKGSFSKLLGEYPSQAKLLEYSSERNVTDNTPPTFLVHASDDNGVKPRNSIVFYEALLAHRVPAELHIYQGGGHGFGLNNPTTQEKWMERLQSWLKANKFL